jgi:hypothetical protein
LLPDFTNAQSEAIRAAFLPQSFRSIQALDGDIGSTLTPTAGFKVTAASGAFTEFQYICSPLELADEAATRARLAAVAKERLIGGDHKFNSTTLPQRGKHIRDYDLPLISDPYVEASDIAAMEAQDKWLRASATNARPFIPAGAAKLQGRPTRAMLHQCVQSLYRGFADDWPDAEPTVVTTAEELIAVYFPLEQVRNVAAVTTYVNNELHRGEACVQYDLRKVPEGWNVRTDDNHLLFTFRPPWVKHHSFIPQAAAAEGAAAGTTVATQAGKGDVMRARELSASAPAPVVAV